jgi:DNA-binding CsgD family transcriptional regulator
MCVLIKLNLSIKEMAALLNISTQGVEKSKYRLKKRLNLNVEDDMTEFLRRF